MAMLLVRVMLTHGRHLTLTTLALAVRLLEVLHDRQEVVRSLIGVCDILWFYRSDLIV